MEKTVKMRRSMAKKPTWITIPERRAEMPLGAAEWASGSQECSGTMAAFTPKPVITRTRAAITGSSGQPEIWAAISDMERLPE